MRLHLLLDKEGVYDSSAPLQLCLVEGILWYKQIWTLLSIKPLNENFRGFLETPEVSWFF